MKSRYSQARSSGVSILFFFLLTPSLQLRRHTSFRPQSFPPYISFSINISSPMALLSLFSISSFFQAIFCGVSFLSLISTLSSTVSLNLISYSSFTHPDGNKNSFDFSLLLIINGQISPTLPLSSPHGCLPSLPLLPSACQDPSTSLLYSLVVSHADSHYGRLVINHPKAPTNNTIP